MNNINSTLQELSARNEQFNTLKDVFKRFSHSVTKSVNLESIQGTMKSAGVCMKDLNGESLVFEYIGNSFIVCPYFDPEKSSGIIKLMSIDKESNTGTEIKTFAYDDLGNINDPHNSSIISIFSIDFLSELLNIIEEQTRTGEYLLQ